MNRPPSTLIIGHNLARDLTRRDEIRRHADDSARYYGHPERIESGIAAGVCLLIGAVILIVVLLVN